jgi:hypothetical protein
MAGSAMTRGCAEGIAIGLGGGTGGGNWLRSAVRNGTFGAVPGGVAGIGTRGGGNGDGRCGTDDAGAGGGGAASALLGASTDVTAIQNSVAALTAKVMFRHGRWCAQCARTLNRPLTLLMPPAGSGGIPALTRTHVR